MRVSSLMLLGMPEVQKELALSDQQIDQLKQLMAETQKQMRSPFGDMTFQEIQQLSQEERTKLLAEARKTAEEANKRTEQKINEILEAKQAKRLSELRIQREGLAAMNRPEVAEELGLSEQQQARIRKIQEESRRPPASGFPGPDATPEERREFFTRMQKQRQKVEADILDVLTDQQRAKWAEMKGKEFKFPQPKFPAFGPGGPGRPGAFGPGAKPARKSAQ
ncbi:MAG: hypothetical protein ACUVUC_13870 [Thermoguttaceae bacterium]